MCGQHALHLGDSPGESSQPGSGLWADLKLSVSQDNSWISDSSASVTCDGSAESCCTGVTVSSTGGVASSYPDMLGTYIQDFTASSDHPTYTKDGYSLYFLDDVLHHFAGWTISDSDTELGPVTNEGEADCAEEAGADWEYLDLSNSQWSSDSSLTVRCQNIAQCCPSLSLSSSGQASQSYPAMMATYSLTGDYAEGRPVYRRDGAEEEEEEEVELRYVNDVTHHWAGWVVGQGQGMGSLSHDGDSDCPSDLPQGWDVADGEGWLADSSLSVQCM